jgi:carboxypeptidase Taq
MKMKFEKLRTLTNKIADIKYAISVLNWDQETYMPSKGQKFRAQQIATLSGLAHELATSPEYEKVIMDLKDEYELNPIEERNVELLLSDYEKSKKLSADFVIKLSQATSKSFHSWIQARKANDFSIFAPELEKMVAIQQEKAAIYGYEQHIYDALMDDYEPKATVAEIDKLFEAVRGDLKPFLDKIAAKPQVEDKFMYGHFDKDKQWNYGLEILAQLGYDFEAGRQDLSEHPFSTSFSSQDVRVTTRVKEDNLYDMLWSCIHECGHALYEQGIPESQYGLPCGEAVSLGIHESQSRFYENNIGRSETFWKLNYSNLQKVFQDKLASVSLGDFYKAVNIVKPSLIRTDADELTYHFHIMIRYELEKQLIDGSLKVKDLKEAWNAGYKNYLNIEVPNDNQGVLQDVHWSHGGFGYFPTYSLGSFYAAQFEQEMSKKMPSINQDLEKGEFTKLLDWLRTNVHQHGRFYSSQDLCIKATGEPLNFKYFMNYAEKKYSKIYRL